MSEPTGEHLTAAQREALEADLVEMEGPKRKAAVEAIKVARSFGDLSENFEYHAAKNEQGLLEARIRTLRHRLDTAEIVEARIRKLQHRLQHAVTVEHDHDDSVGVGSIVEILDGDGERMEVEISSVGGVSPDSPLGSALIGAAVGATVEVTAPRGSWRATIVSIRRA